MNLKDLLRKFKSRRSGRPIYHPAGCRDAVIQGVPDFVQPLVGWRAWKVWAPRTGSAPCPVFSSVILDTSWVPRRRFTAEHSFDLGAKCHGLLKLDCSCGVYAFKDPIEAFIYMMQVRDRLLGMSVEVALGSVNLWGRVVDCESGYKAQYAYPCHFYLPASFARFLPEVGSAFGIPTGIYMSTFEEEIRLTFSSGSTGQNRQELNLKKSGSVTPKGFPYKAGFYDITPLPERGESSYHGRF
ncbi:MAG: hypothetical protein M1423_00145 [Acidobacteria bacterium]|nr:hypothetical protein [Acidobacteriota bacterium]